MTVEDLVPINIDEGVPPRPQGTNSIPSLLKAFQSEWDAMALEMYQLRTELAQTKQELGTTLYTHDAACRVIAKIMAERDEARDALAKLSFSVGNDSNGYMDAMDVDGGIPKKYLQMVDETLNKLSSARKKRKTPASYIKPSDFESFKCLFEKSISIPSCALVTTNTDNVLLGDNDGYIHLFDKASNLLQTSKMHHSLPVTSLSYIMTDSEEIVLISSSTDGKIRLWTDNLDEKTVIQAYADGVAGISVHPSQKFMASISSKGSRWSLHSVDLIETFSTFTDDTEFCCISFHPDGHLLGIGARDGTMRIYEVKTGDLAATFGPFSGSVKNISFSENGHWLAISAENEKSVRLLSLRNLKEFDSIPINGEPASIQFDESGQYLAIAFSSEVIVQMYDKKSKSWSTVYSKSSESTVRSLSWGLEARALYVQSMTGMLEVYSI